MEAWEQLFKHLRSFRYVLVYAFAIPLESSTGSSAKRERTHVENHECDKVKWRSPEVAQVTSHFPLVSTLVSTLDRGWGM